MSLSICFTRRFVRLCDELEIPIIFLKYKIAKSLQRFKRKIKTKRIYFDTHGNVKSSMYYSNPRLIMLITYSVENLPKYLKQKYFFRDLFHELRHFQQDKIFSWDMNEYSMKDLNEGNSAYFNSKIEKDARKYEKRGIRVYKTFKKLFG